MDFLEKEDIYDEGENRKKGIFISIALHILLLLFWFTPFFNEANPIDTFQGILISFGEPEEGGGDSRKEKQITLSENMAPSEEREQLDRVEEVVSPKTPSTKDISKEVERPIKSTVLKNDAAVVIADPDTKTKESKRKEEVRAQKENERKEQEAREASARKKKKYEKSKKEFGDLFSKGKGKGENKGGGDQGDPRGDPDASVLEGMSTGLGELGGGISDRGLVFEPEINDHSQRAGIVVIKVCVNNKGKVNYAKFTQRGSTTTDRTLVNLAENAAMKYRFSASQVEKQCGTIAINFKLR